MSSVYRQNCLSPSKTNSFRAYAYGDKAEFELTEYYGNSDKRSGPLQRVHQQIHYSMDSVVGVSTRSSKIALSCLLREIPSHSESTAAAEDLGKSPKAGKNSMTSARKSVGDSSFSHPAEFSLHTGQFCLEGKEEKTGTGWKKHEHVGTGNISWRSNISGKNGRPDLSEKRQKWVQRQRSPLLLAEDGNVNKLYFAFGHARAVFRLVPNIFFL